MIPGHVREGKIMKKLVLLLMIVLVTGCTSIKVQEIDPSLQLSHVCIEDNPKVIAGDFIPVVKKGFERHGITTEEYKGERPSHCEYHLTYTAFLTWDMGMYMHHAELQLYQGIKPVAYAEYHLNGKGGLALNKWASVESKMTPVIDKFLINYTPAVVDTYRKPIQANVVSNMGSDDKPHKLRELKLWFEEGLITEQEYNTAKQRILSQ